MQQLRGLRSKMATAAQLVYDEWDEDDEDGTEGGICDEIASRIQEVISSLPDVDITDGGHDGDDHAWTIAYNDQEAFGVDIAPHVYERGGGYSWTKIPGVTFDEQDINIFKLRRSDITEEILKDENGKPIRFLHGTTKDFDEFKPGKHKKGSQLGFGIHFTQSPELASHYTGHQDVTKTGSKPGGNVRLAYLDVKKAFDQTKLYDVNSPEHEFAVALLKGTGRKPIVDGGKVYVNLDVVSPQKAEKTLRQFGYDAVIYDAVVGRRTFQGGRIGFTRDIVAKSVLVLDPNQIKPVFSKA